MTQTRLAGVLAAIGLMTAGCGTLPDSTLGHKCGIPEGVGCLSTQEVYERTAAGDLPGLDRVDGAGRMPAPQDRGAEMPIVTDNGPRVLRTSALYASPEEPRIWVNRWRDKDGDLHDDSFMYVLVGEGQWLVRD